MRSLGFALLLATLAACSKSPTGNGGPDPLPTGTMLVDTPNGPENGTYLVDVTTGSIRQIAAAGDPLRVSFQGGYSAVGNRVFGSGRSTPRDIVQIEIGTGTSQPLAVLPPNTSLGAYDLSPDGHRLVVQTEQATGIRLWTVHLPSNSWTPLIDVANRLDTLPIARLRWTPEGNEIYGLVTEFPERTELVRITLATQLFQSISPVTPMTMNPSVDVSPDGRVVAHADGNARIIFRDRNGVPLTGYPEIPGRVARPAFSPDGRFLAFEQHGLEPPFAISIIIVRLSDGKRWDLEMDADFEVWLADWF